MARQPRRVPTWIFHGEIDPAVPADESRKAFAALQAAGAPAQYTEVLGVAVRAAPKSVSAPKR